MEIENETQYLNRVNDVRFTIADNVIKTVITLFILLSVYCFVLHTLRRLLLLSLLLPPLSLSLSRSCAFLLGRRDDLCVKKWIKPKHLYRTIWITFECQFITYSWRVHIVFRFAMCYTIVSVHRDVCRRMMLCVMCTMCAQDINKHAANCIFLFRQKLFMFIIDKVIVQVELSLSFCYYTPNCFFMFVYIINVTIVNKRFIKYFALLLTFVWFKSTIYLTNLIPTVFFLSLSLCSSKEEQLPRII